MNASDVWYGSSLRDRALRALLAPASAAYAAVTTARNMMYDRKLLHVDRFSIPVISVGNLTVGGTGKTPFTAYLVHRLAAMGERPAVVTRDYGGDERLVHELLNPGVSVHVAAERAAGVRAAAAAGASVAVLDDAFQHRRAARELDIVLVSAERWQSSARVLPAGPLREPMRGLCRAGLLVVTSKSASAVTADAAAVQLGRLCPGTGQIRAGLHPAELVDVTAPERRQPLSMLAGSDVVAAAGVGDPSSFFEQLEQLGARVTRRVYRDHQPYSGAEVRDLMLLAGDGRRVVVTAKDAVKLSPLWPAKAPPAWYVSQVVRITHGDTLLTDALAAATSR